MLNGLSDTNRTVYEQLYDMLKENGYNVYSPGQHKGEVLEQYVVISESGTVKGHSLLNKTYKLICYVPFNQYSKMERMTNKLKQDMIAMFPLLRPTGNETPAIYDEKVRGYTASIEYINYRKNINWSVT